MLIVLGDMEILLICLRSTTENKLTVCCSLHADWALLRPFAQTITLQLCCYRAAE